MANERRLDADELAHAQTCSICGLEAVPALIEEVREGRKRVADKAMVNDLDWAVVAELDAAAKENVCGTITRAERITRVVLVKLGYRIEGEPVEEGV